ncbi:MAG: YgiT-type zinc finger protein [Defluviitaleaceae bacterium]|nr:YgiT-type zinc finger protein [Defluviitaleaceae bacterium]
MEDHLYSEFEDYGVCAIIVRGVPCHKCSMCGEIAYDLKVGVRVEEIMEAIKESLSKEIAVIQYSPTEIEVVKYTDKAA